MPPARRRRVLGKDPSKVDRSAAYAGRYVAKNIVAAGLASRALIQVSYAIGVAEPTSVMVNTFGTGRVSDAVITKLVREHFDLRPKGIIKMLDLLRPIYEKTAAYGHFGREEPEFSWEATDKALPLKRPASSRRHASRKRRSLNENPGIAGFYVPIAAAIGQRRGSGATAIVARRCPAVSVRRTRTSRCSRGGAGG